MLAELVRRHAASGGSSSSVGVIGALAAARDAAELTSASYLPDPSGFMSAGINEALAYINDNLTEPFSETDLAAIAGLSAGAFSRSFRRHTGLALVQFINRLRINFACQLLMDDEELRITEVCFASGFNNLSNFNRQFLKQKGMTPSRFRALLARTSPRRGGAAEDEGQRRAAADGLQRFAAGGADGGSQRNRAGQAQDRRTTEETHDDHDPSDWPAQRRSPPTLARRHRARCAQSGTVAFLMPDQGSTRYEEHDFPGFKAEMEKLCPDCQVIYQNANADVALQQQQFNSVLTQGAKVVVLDPVELGRRRLAGASSPRARA